MGIIPHPSNRVEESEEKSGKKEQKEVLKNDSGIRKGENESLEKERKISLGQRIEDGLLIVVSTKTYGHTVKALIDSGANRCFVTPACVMTCGLKANSVMYSLNWEMEKNSYPGGLYLMSQSLLRV